LIKRRTFHRLEKMGDGTVDAKALYAQAERCHRLADAMYTPAVVAELETHARRLEELADRLKEAECLDGLSGDQVAHPTDGQK